MVAVKTRRPPLDKHRLASAVIGAAWILLTVVIGAYQGGGRFDAPPGVAGALGGLINSLIVLVPIVAIWFPRDLGNGVPAGFIRFVGWVALLILTVLPVVLFAVLAPR